MCVRATWHSSSRQTIKNKKAFTYTTLPITLFQKKRCSHFSLLSSARQKTKISLCVWFNISTFQYLTAECLFKQELGRLFYIYSRAHTHTHIHTIHTFRQQTLNPSQSYFPHLLSPLPSRKVGAKVNVCLQCFSKCFEGGGWRRWKLVSPSIQTPLALFFSLQLNNFNKKSK